MINLPLLFHFEPVPKLGLIHATETQAHGFQFQFSLALSHRGFDGQWLSGSKGS